MPVDLHQSSVPTVVADSFRYLVTYARPRTFFNLSKTENKDNRARSREPVYAGMVFNAPLSMDDPFEVKPNPIELPQVHIRLVYSLRHPFAYIFTLPNKVKLMDTHVLVILKRNQMYKELSILYEDAKIIVVSSPDEATFIGNTTHYRYFNESLIKKG